MNQIPSITTTSLKAATLKKEYSVTLKASGTAPLTWTATGLPKGLSIAKATGVISGKPTKSGTFSVKITAKNGIGSSQKTLKLKVNKTDASTSSDSLDDYEDGSEREKSGTSSGTTGESVSSLPESSLSTPTQTEGYMIAYLHLLWSNFCRQSRNI